MLHLFSLTFIVILINYIVSLEILTTPFNEYDRKYGHFSENQRVEMLQSAREMFQFGYDSYMTHAFPKDELDPIHCTGRGPDHDNPSNININDVLGDYSLTLVDTLDTLAIMGNSSEFQHAVQLVIDNVSFDTNSTVQVFEATIRVVGALLSSHLIIKDPQQPFGDMSPPDYDDELLHMAHDLVSRLMPAFEYTGTGIPYPRVNLQRGVPHDCTNETCTAGAGTLLLEFGILGRLLGDPVYEAVARRAVERLWSYRSNVTGLFGNIIDIQTGQWKGHMSGLGAGLDSFFEYLLKAFILFGDEEDLRKFNDAYETIRYYMRKGRKDCNSGSGFPPIFVNVNMKTGDVVNNWIDALQAAWAGVQVLTGDIEDAICLHALYYSLWQKYGALPERYNWNIKEPEVLFYPLRPELVESTYLLYQATKNPFYLHVGKNILDSLNNHTRVKCGYATLHNVKNKDHEDRMESFFLSETCKYLYLLFDKDNHVNRETSKYLFSTEGHLFPISYSLRKKPWEEAGHLKISGMQPVFSKSTRLKSRVDPVTKSTVVVDTAPSNATEYCDKIPDIRRYMLPLEGRYMEQMETLVGLRQGLSCT